MKRLALTAVYLLCNLAYAAEQPNILLILADDLGYSDLGCYGGEIETPNLDELAAGGLRYTQFYNTARCWPTRAAMMTGYYAQQVRRDTLPGIKRGNRPEWAKLFTEYLKDGGYRCYHSGKWHIDGMPLQNGFDRSYYVNNHGFFRLKSYFLDDKKQPGFEPRNGWYVTTAKADHAIAQLKEHAETHADKPFFQFLAFTAPHFPLHALPEDIKLFRDRYKAGWNKIQTQRWKRQKKLGIAKNQLPSPEPELGPPYHFDSAYKILGPGEVRFPKRWDSLSIEQKEFQTEKMAIHAAMVYRMDLEIGRVLKQIREMNEFEDTLILFLSDNGASSEIMVRGDGHDPEAPPGSAFTYLCLGPGWSTACNTPFRKHKTWVHEGGAATPLIVHWPNGIQARGELNSTVGHVIDIAPTLLEVTGGKAQKNWHNRNAPKAPGQSLFLSFTQVEPEKRKKPLWFSHDGHRALRDGDWKLVATKGGKWELYDLANDRNEVTNLASRLPERVKRMEKQWGQMQKEFIKTAKLN